MTSSKSRPAARPRAGQALKQEAKPQHKYRLMFLPEALAEYRALDGSVQAVVKKLLGKRLARVELRRPDLRLEDWLPTDGEPPDSAAG